MPKRTAKPAKPKAKRGKAVSKKRTKAVQLPPPAAPQVAIQGKFDPKYVAVAAKMAERGFIDREIADTLGIEITTFHRWKAAHPELLKALKTGKELPDQRVERSLFNRAVGYTFESEELFVDRFGDEHRMATVKHVPPDTTAQIFWLKNRRPDEWRDRQEISHTVTTADDLAAARRRALERSVVAEQPRAA